MSIPMQSFNFNHLSVKDLVEARDMFHVHLMNKKNVVATAIGRYLIRMSEIDANGVHKAPKEGGKQLARPPRTLENSVVMDISWPCILVFVKQWETEKSLSDVNAQDVVPKTIYMPDGRIVPVCVVEAPKSEVTDDAVNVSKLHFPVNLIGGGFPLYIRSQGVNRVATLGCVVTDGHKYYALTNRHVTGQGVEPVYAVMGGKETLIGQTSGRSIGKIRFSDLYDGWRSDNIFVGCDAGLIEIEDITQWKTDVIDIGTMGELYDLNTLNIALSLIAEHPVKGGKRQPSLTGNVVAYGAYSNLVKGEIAALFYRYRSVGGVEYVSDFLISGRDGSSLKMHHGDSGALWHLEVPAEGNTTDYQPIALHWGQHEFIQKQQNEGYTFSLSTCLSNICRELDIELVRGWNLDNDYSWGKTGHYKIAARACEIVSNRKLSKLLMANQQNISFTDDGMLAGEMKEAKWGQFCALADVPDIIWRMTRKADEANHFADMDQSNPDVMDGKTLLDICKKTDGIDIDVWNEYYQALEAVDSNQSPDKRGALPFRVWQAFNLMVEYLKAGKVAEFICVGGTVSHYLGDACQPLHVSYLHHGHPGNEDEKKVHSVYETNMMDRYMQELLDGVNQKFSTPQTYTTYGTGKEAAVAVVKLMRKVVTNILPPEDIIDVYNQTDGRGRIDNMWNELGKKTIDCVAAGCLNLALFWESAWEAGEGDKLKAADLQAIDQQTLMDLYMTFSFFPSFKLKDPKYKQAL